MTTNVIKSDRGLDKAARIASTKLCIAYGRTGIGGRSENQDSYGGAFAGQNVILTVCDGMGGMNGGQTASLMAATEIVHAILDTQPRKWDQDTIKKAITNANAAIYKRSMAEPHLRGMGTTATVVMITPEAAFLTHIGDSRIYQLRNGKKIFRTFDHSRVFEMVSQNMITEEQARTSSFSNVITRALGIRPAVEFTVEKLPYRNGDRFILCCDGIWNCTPEPEIIEFFNQEKFTYKEIDHLTETVNGLGIENGAHHDNLTAIVADMLCDSEYQYSIFRPLLNTLKRLSEKKKNKAKEKKKNETQS